ncbi:alpha,alpha-trehalose-phosphate synthase (UDP-forming) [Salinicola peritrichatus]|uniref:alpha,alpha-trehalose-phosphate synthase (UDP-forming) n=1 Tax=Salinicola peritrichatus TaxID=1267424 RepID=UPI000DA190F0|nr:trehalose-6-phosphate synthase [Salinicola peritrichatus]
MRDLVIVSNRVSVPQAGRQQAGGLAVAINNALASHGGIWFGWNGEVSDARESARCTQRGNVTYATLPLQQREHDEYYLGFSNEVLWPIFHLNLGAMNFHRRFAETYYATNERFASEITPLLKGNELIWVHDYHLIPLGNALRRRDVDTPIGFFLHIPFPSAELLRCIPGHKRLLMQFLDYDLLGFQTPRDQESFRDAATRILGATVKGNVLFHGDRRVRLGTYPVGVDVDTLQQESQHSETKRTLMNLRASLGHCALIAGADRLDYSKGLSMRLGAIQELLEHYPEYRRKVLYTQVASPSRCAINEYDELRQKLETQAGHINGLYSDLGWAPVHYINKTYPRAVLMGLFRAARVGLVTPVRDGMNLVCKEFVAAQDPQDPGVLVLSEFAGAAQELDGALLVNPYDPHTITQALHQALQMPQEERRQRHASMLKNLTHNSLTQWWQRFVEDLRYTLPHALSTLPPARRSIING